MTKKKENLPGTGKQRKTGKTFNAKKLPVLLKKSYTENSFKKFLKKIYIPSDEEFIRTFFEQDSGAHGNFRIPEKAEFSKKDFKRLRRIAHEVKKQKGIIKIVPLAAVIIFLCAAASGTVLFKNSIVKTVLTDSLQKIFDAKTDITAVDVKILDSSLTITGLAQASKEKPFTNLFTAGKIVVDFNLTQALRGKFDAQKVAVTGITINTPRTVSGALKDSGTSESKRNTVSGKTAAGSGTASVQKAQEKLSGLLSDFSVEKTVEKISKNFTSPAAAAAAEQQLNVLIPEWKEKTAAVKTAVGNLSADASDITTTDWNHINDYSKLAAALEQAEHVLSEGQNLEKTLQSAKKSLETDSRTVKSLAAELESAANEDRTMIAAQLEQAKNILPDDSGTLASDALEPFFTQLFGNYYPAVLKLTDYAARLKKTAKSGKKQTHSGRRAPGRTVFYKKDTVPAFLIEQATVSGSGFSAVAKEISNDPDLRGTPAVLTGTLEKNGSTGTLHAVIDARTTTDNPLAVITCQGNNYPFKSDFSTLAVQARSSVSLTATAGEDGALGIDSLLKLTSAELSAEPFEPGSAYRLYRKALSSVHALTIGIKASYAPDSAAAVSVTTDADKQISAALNTLAASELASLQKGAEQRLYEKLAAETDSTTDKIKEFTGIETGLNTQATRLDAINKLLSAKKETIAETVKKKAAEQVSSQLKDKASVLKKLF